MKVLLTGAGGFVGHHILQHFIINTDWEIVCTDSFRHRGTSARLREVLDSNEKRVKVVTHDLTTPIDSVTAHEFGDISVIFNVASESHVDRSIEDPRPFVENNVALALTMLDYAKNLDNLDLFLQVSTDEVYGAAKEGHAHKEWESIIPSNPYSASKAAQEAIATSYWRTYGVPLVISNTMNIFGERQDAEKFIPMTMKNIIAGNKQEIHARNVDGEWIAGSRFYLHARNQADALMFIANNHKRFDNVRYTYGAEYPERLHVVGEREVKNDEMALMIAKALGKEVDIEYIDFHSTRPGHDARYALDGSKIASYGWVPPIPLEASLDRTVQWTLNNQRWL